MMLRFDFAFQVSHGANDAAKIFSNRYEQALQEIKHQEAIKRKARFYFLLRSFGDIQNIGLFKIELFFTMQTVSFLIG